MKCLDLSSPISIDQPSTSQHPNQQCSNEIGNGTLKDEGEISDAAVHPKEGWVNLFKNNRSVMTGMTLNYHPPQIVGGKTIVQLEKIHVDKEVEKWNCALIAYMIGPKPGYNAMKRYINQQWSSVDEPDIFLDEEAYVIKFQSLADKNEILYTGPYTMNNRPIFWKQ